MPDPAEQTDPKSSDAGSSLRLFLRIGPALITASVVLGPGSILSACKNGYSFGYSMAWILGAAVVLMILTTALSARLGVVLEGTLCDELAKRLGRWAAVVTGGSLFLVAACFQFSNNLGVIGGLEPFLDRQGPPATWESVWRLCVIFLINGLALAALFMSRSLYKPVETVMKVLVAVMIVGFAGNLILAQPDMLALAKGLIPQPPQLRQPVVEEKQEEKASAKNAETAVVKAKQPPLDITPIIAIFGTTFSVGGAFYQSYLVRKKGWGKNDLKLGMIDSAVGISVLGLVTLMILATAAAVFSRLPDAAEPKSMSEVATVLGPMFGSGATYLFCMGILAGAAGSFFVNAMIGGTVLADSLGLGGDIDASGPKICTALALLTGMAVAVITVLLGKAPVSLIIFAQAMTVLGLPALAVAMLYLATRSDVVASGLMPKWLRLGAVLAILAVSVMAVMQAQKVLTALSTN